MDQRRTLTFLNKICEKRLTDRGFHFFGIYIKYGAPISFVYSLLHNFFCNEKHKCLARYKSSALCCTNTHTHTHARSVYTLNSFTELYTTHSYMHRHQQLLCSTLVSPHMCGESYHGKYEPVFIRTCIHFILIQQ